MTTNDSSPAFPTQPKPDWDVTPYRTKWKDVRASVLFLIGVGIVMALSLLPSLNKIQFGAGTVSEFLFSTSIILALPGLVAYGVQREGVREKTRSAKWNKIFEWEDKELIPYLEHKYGVKFTESNSSVVVSLGLPTVYLASENRSMRVRVQGITPLYDEEWSCYSYTVGKRIWLEEVIQPQKTTFRALAPVN